MNVVGIDIGGTNFRIGLVDDSQNVVKLEKVPVKTVFNSDDALSDLANKIIEFTKEEQYGAVAIGFPATMNVDRTRVVQAPNIAFMENLPVCEVLEKKLNVPVVAERDVTFALSYDMHKYELPNEGIICGIYYGTGIGNAICINGVPLTGQHGCAGEIGHIPVFVSTEVCGCGNVGCLEAEAGGKALAKIQQEDYPETSIGDMFSKHANAKKVKNIVELMANAVATEVNILDPAYVLLGGGVFKMKDFPIEMFNEFIQQKVRKPLPLNELKIVYTEDEIDKSVVGASIYARNKFKM